MIWDPTEAVANQCSWFLVSPFFGLGIKHTLEPLQADLGVGISRFGARIVPSRGGKRGPVASMGGGWPNNHGEQRPTVRRYALDRSHRRSLDSRASIFSPVILTYKDFDGAWHGQHHSSLIHVIDILGQDSWIF